MKKRKNEGIEALMETISILKELPNTSPALLANDRIRSVLEEAERNAQDELFETLNRRRK